VSARVLLADDDPASTELVLSFLQSNGYRVSTASDGNRALELGASGDYELVILDVHMPLYDGVEVVEMLRKRHVLHPIKIIGLTGDTSEDVRLALVRGGVDGFLTKPVNLALLREEVHRLVVA